MYTIPSLIKYIVRVLTSDSLRYARAYDTEFFFQVIKLNLK